MPDKIRTRFAPSPTGYLHIGGLRTALYAYLFAKKNNGEFVLRIEDTDQERLVTGSTENIIKTLQWAGTEYDAGPGKDDDLGPYIQSERLKIYREHIEKLIENGNAYRCFCTKERLEELRKEQIATKQAPMYDKKCRYLSTEEIKEKLDNKVPFVVRQAIPTNELVKFNDIVRNKVKFDTNTLDDHVLLKSDGFPTYHLAVVVDDHLMKITHVIRGEEWLPSTPKHILLFRAFGWEPTTYAHLPLLLNKDRSKLSKRQNDVSVESYIENGYDKDALINFIALLGWNSSDDQEIYSLEELQEEFELERVQKSGAIFDLEKLNWFDWQWRRRKYLENLKKTAKEIDADAEIQQQKKGHLKFNFSSPHHKETFTRERGRYLKEMAEEHLTKDILKEESKNEDFFAKVLISIEEKILKEPENTTGNIHFYFKEEFKYNKDLFLHEKMKVNQPIAVQALKSAIGNLEESDFETEEKLKEKFLQFIQDLGLKNGQVLWPVRVALSNEQYSPGVFEICYVLGYEKTITRLNQALESIK